MELLQTAPPICGWVAITFGIGPHSSYFSVLAPYQKLDVQFSEVKNGFRFCDVHDCVRFDMLHGYNPI